MSAVTLDIPPLRERRDDIPLLADHFLRICSEKMNKTIEGFSQDCLDLLVSYHWPGNVRQVQHEIERAVALTPDGDLVLAEQLSEEILGGARSVLRTRDGGQLSQVVEMVERRMIAEALRKYGGNRSRAARHLGLSRRGLLNKINRYSLSESSLH